MNADQVRALLNEVAFLDYTFEVIEDQGHLFLRAVYHEADTYSGAPARQLTRKWHISRHAVKSEIVQTAFKLCLTSMEHRTREAFLYKGERIFGPHFDVEALYEIARQRQLDYRGKQ